MIRVAVVGLGTWGNKILSTLSELGDLDIVPITREDPVCLNADAAIISTPASAHAMSAMPYIKKGVPVFIEKPMALTVRDAEMIQTVSESSGSAIFVGHLYLFHGAFKGLLKNLDVLGNIQEVRFVGMSIGGRDDGSPLSDWLPHGLTLASSVLTIPPMFSEVSSSSRYVCSGAYTFDDIPFNYSVGWHRDTKEMKFEVIGERGTLTFDDTSGKKLTYIANGVENYLQYDTKPALTAELEAFKRVIRGEPVPKGVRVSDGLEVTKLIVEAEESLSQST